MNCAPRIQPSLLLEFKYGRNIFALSHVISAVKSSDVFAHVMKLFYVVYRWKLQSSLS